MATNGFGGYKQAAVRNNVKKTILILSALLWLEAAPMAHADRGVWYENGTLSWTTYFNIVNLSDTHPAVARLTFYDMGGTLLGTVSKSIPANGLWSVSTAATGSTVCTPAILSAAGRGSVMITASGGKISAYTSQFNATYNTGFNFIVNVGGDDGVDDGGSDGSGLSDSFDSTVETSQHNGH